MSASTQYDCLCLLKDVKKLRKAVAEDKADQVGLYTARTGGLLSSTA